MKNTNTYNLAIIATSLALVYFASGIVSIAQATELLKAEPIEQSIFVQEAKDNLALSFTALTISQDTSEDIAKNMMVKQKDAAKQNKAVSLTKTALIAE
jgi:hypothetical protein